MTDELKPSPMEGGLNTELKKLEAEVDKSVVGPAARQAAQEVAKVLDDVFQVQISEDGFRASAVVRQNHPPVQTTAAEIKQFLAKNKIIYGIKEKALEELMKQLQPNSIKKNLVVAEGKPMVEGKKGFVDFKFRTKILAGKENEDKIDFKERGLINNVKEKDLLAVVTPEVPGVPGMRVTGEAVPPAPVNPVKKPGTGLNVAVSPDGNTYTSTIMGNARLVFKEIQVTPDFIVKGDLDLTKGNIDFVGNVLITGSVASGFTVKAGGDVVIGGSVEPDAVI